MGGSRGTVNPERGFALVGIIFGSVVLHELGHSLVGLHSGIPAKAIVLLPIGGVTLLDETRQRLEPTRRQLDAGYPDCPGRAAGEPARRLSSGEHLARGVPGDSALGEALGLFRESAAQPGMGQYLACGI